MRDKLRAVTLAGVLVGWSAVAPRIPSRWHPAPHAAFGTAAATLARADLGLRPPALWAGLRWGASAAAPVLLAVAAATATPLVRGGMAERVLPVATVRWLLLHIPIGTVWAEEAAYRAALGTVAARAFGGGGGRLVTAATFGLSHVPDARSTGQPVPVTVFVTGVAGWVFAWLYEKSGSLSAPILAHLAINEAGAVAALAVQRRRRYGRGRPTGGVPSSGRRSRN